MGPRKLSFDKIVSPDKIPLNWPFCVGLSSFVFRFFYHSVWVAGFPDLDIRK